jgi:hypothetical protein
MFKDTNQNFWQLASIQSAALGVQGMLIGKHLANQYGEGVAITSLCIGNLILWIIALSMFSMTYHGQGKAKHAIENVLTYFGKPLSIVAALVLMVAFISWFPVQINAQMDYADKILIHYSNWGKTAKLISMIISAFLIIGLSTFGIRVIKWICTLALPLLIIYVIYAFCNRDVHLHSIEWGVSHKGIIPVVIIVFPGIINLPTFLRHARSRQDGILALTLMTIFVIGFQAATIWFHFTSDPSSIFAPYLPEIGWTINLLSLLGFIFLATLCVNIVNIYFASAALEFVIPNFTDARGYVLIGLIGALALSVFKSETIVNGLETITNNFIGSLGVVLVVGYLSRIIIVHRFRRLEKEINILCWIIGCTASLYAFFMKKDITTTFISGIFTSALSFIIIIFIEETVWSIRRIFYKKPDHS